MNITPLDLGAWISIYCGFTLLRSNTVPCRRESLRFGPGRTRVVTGALLMIAGLAALVVAIAWHFLRGA